MDLISKTPEALAWCTSQEHNLSALVRLGNEDFRAIVTGVFASDSPDSQGDIVPVRELERIVTRIAARPLFVNVHHDPRIPPVGRVLVAKLFRSPSGVNFIAGLIGHYSAAAYSKFAAVPTSGAPPSSVDSEGPAATVSATIGFDPYQLERDAIAGFLYDAPPGVELSETDEVHKTADHTLICVTVALTFFGLKSFTEGFAKRLGERAADGTIDMLRWISEKFASRLHLAFQKRPSVLTFSIPIAGLDVSFVVEGSNVSLLSQAANALPVALVEAELLLYGHRSALPIALTFRYRGESGWQPLYLITERDGVICDEPYQRNIEDLHGLSIGGTAVRERR